MIVSTGAEGGEGGNAAEVARLVEILALASVSASTSKVYLSKWKTWVGWRTRLRKSPWLREAEGTDTAVREITEFMAFRCFVCKNQSQTIRGYLAAIKYFHKMFAGWELPTSHCMVIAVEKGIDRAHGKSDIKPRVRQPLTWAMLTDGKSALTDGGIGWQVVWLGLALSYFLLCRASEIWAYNNGLVHSEYCLTRGDLTFFVGPVQLEFSDRRKADRVEVRFRASKTDKKRLGAIVTRTKAKSTTDSMGNENIEGALELILDLLDIHPELGLQAPLMQTTASNGWKVISRTEATLALRMLVSSTGRDPLQYALHSGRIGGATQLAAQGAAEIQIKRAGRWKSSAFMTYVRAGGEGADFVSQALAHSKFG